MSRHAASRPTPTRHPPDLVPFVKGVAAAPGPAVMSAPTIGRSQDVRPKRRGKKKIEHDRHPLACRAKNPGTDHSTETNQQTSRPNEPLEVTAELVDLTLAGGRKIRFVHCCRRRPHGSLFRQQWSGPKSKTTMIMFPRGAPSRLRLAKVGTVGEIF